MSHGARTRKVVALTFDDGWNPGNTRRILGILQRAHVNATFFPVGRAIIDYPGVWKAVVNAGFGVGDHTYDHSDLRGLCYQRQLAELTRQASIVRSKLGVAALPFMRPPYGSYSRVTQLAASAAHERYVVLWDVDTLDWTGLSGDEITARALSGGRGSIVLMHTFPPNTTAALPAIIAGYRARGYRFVTVGQLLGGSR